MSILSKSKKDDVIALFLEERKPRVSAIAKELGVSKGLVSLVLSELEDIGVLDQGRLDERKAEILRRILTLRDLLHTDFSMVGRKYGLKGIGIFGSYINGIFDRNSDVDVWVKVEKKLTQKELAALREDLERLFGRRVDLIVLDNRKLSSLRERASPLFYDLLHSVVVWGDLF